MIPVRRANFPAKNELNTGINQFDCLGPLVGFFCISFLSVLTHLPIPPSLVAQRPIFHIVRFWVPVGSAQVGVISVVAGVAIFDPSQRFIQSARSEIQA